MNTTLSTDWITITGTYDPRDLHMDLHNGSWAEIGPDRGNLWSWSVMEATADGCQEDVDSGLAHGEAGAKAAVADWAEDDLLVAEITGELLSGAFAVYGHTKAAVAHAALAVAATTQIAR